MRIAGPGGVYYGIELLDSTLAKIVEVESNGKFYAAVQKPGDGFSVRVYRCLQCGADPPQQPMIIDCYLDGKTVGYSKKFQAGGSHSARFDGFRLDGDWRKVTSFVFAAPQQRLQDVEHDGGHGTGDLGTVKVVFIPAETYECPGPGECHRCRKYAGVDKHKGHGARAPSMQQLPDGKKFYMAPSLGASTGRTVYRAVQPRKVHFRHAPGAVKISLTLRYETVSILALRKILDPAVPEHVELINRSKAPVQKTQKAQTVSSKGSVRDPTDGVGFGSQNRFSQASDAGMSTQGDDVKPEVRKLGRISEHRPLQGLLGVDEEEDVKPRKKRRAGPPVYIDLGDD